MSTILPVPVTKGGLCLCCVCACVCACACVRACVCVYVRACPYHKYNGRYRGCALKAGITTIEENVDLSLSPSFSPRCVCVYDCNVERGTRIGEQLRGRKADIISTIDASFALEGPQGKCSVRRAAQKTPRVAERETFVAPTLLLFGDVIHKVGISVPVIVRHRVCVLCAVSSLLGLTS